MNDNSLQVTILERAKQFLGMQGQSSNATDLYTLLVHYRNQMHPDRYADSELKKSAEERFKQTEQLIQELRMYIETEIITMPPALLECNSASYDYFHSLSSLDVAMQQIDELKRNLETKDWHIEQLEKKLADKSDKKFEDERKRLESLYKISGKGWTSLGITLALTASITIMTKIEDVSTKIKRYFPVDEKYFNYLILFFLIIVIALAIKRIIENSVMKRRVREVCSTKTPVDFVRKLEKYWEEDVYNFDEEVAEFTEYQVFQFLYGSEHWWKKWLSALGFVYFQVQTVDQLKDFFISTLLHKELATISHADGLDRTFKIRRKRR